MMRYKMESSALAVERRARTASARGITRSLKLEADTESHSRLDCGADFEEVQGGIHSEDRGASVKHLCNPTNSVQLRKTYRKMHIVSYLGIAMTIVSLVTWRSSLSGLGIWTDILG